MAVLRAQVEAMKRDYIQVLQSSITVPSGDVLDGTSVTLYGGNVHRIRIQSLLEEAREINPSLPTYESLRSCTTHVDEYGFIHEHKTEGLVLHYAAQQLVKHYNRSIEPYEQHQRAWRSLLDPQEHDQPLFKCKELKVMCRLGIPAQFRSEVWKRLVYAQVKDIRADKGPHYYNHLVNCLHDSEYDGAYKRQIALDLMRTMPYNVNFNSQDSEGVQKMREILEAYCIHNPTVGYCQGMNFIVALCLLIMQPEETFWTLIAVTEKYFGPHYFDQNLTGAQADQEVLKDIIMEKLPGLYRHLDNLDIEISTVTLNWFLALFFDAVPFETLLRIWDSFLLEGPKVLFRFSTALLKLNETGIRMKKDTIGIMKHLKCCARLAYDSEQLVKTAFEGIKPFPRRKDLLAKQVVYLNALKEKMRRRQIYKRSLTEQELGLMNRGLTHLKPVIECAIPCKSDYVWIVSSSQTTSHISVLTCATCATQTLQHTIDSRVMCGCCIGHDQIVLGTLSWHLHVFSIQTREPLWCLRLQESVMSLEFHESSHNMDRLFCGLANGTIAILENVRKRQAIEQQPYYIPISHNAVTSLLLVKDEHIWAGCGPNIYILHALTLDTLEKFPVSINSFDHVSNLVTSVSDDVWVTVKGSAHVQLYDSDSLTCRINFDVSSNKITKKQKSPERLLHHPINSSRITSILSMDNSIWIATASGCLYMYDIREIIPINRKYSYGQTPNTTSGRNSPIDGFETEKLLERVNQLYYDRLFQDRKLQISHDVISETEAAQKADTQSEEKANVFEEQDSVENTVETHAPQPQRNESSATNGEVQSGVQGSLSNQCSLTVAADTHALSSFDNISFEESVQAGCTAVNPDTRSVMKQPNDIIDKSSYDSMSLTSNSSFEESRNAIAKVLCKKLAEIQLQRQISGYALPATILARINNDSVSSSSSMDDSRALPGRLHKPGVQLKTVWNQSSSLSFDYSLDQDICPDCRHCVAVDSPSDLTINNTHSICGDDVSNIQNHVTSPESLVYDTLLAHSECCPADCKVHLKIITDRCEPNNVNVDKSNGHLDDECQGHSDNDKLAPDSTDSSSNNFDKRILESVVEGSNLKHTESDVIKASNSTKSSGSTEDKNDLVLNESLNDTDSDVFQNSPLLHRNAIYQAEAESGNHPDLEHIVSDTAETGSDSNIPEVMCDKTKSTTETGCDASKPEVTHTATSASNMKPIDSSITEKLLPSSDQATNDGVFNFDSRATIRDLINTHNPQECLITAGMGLTHAPFSPALPCVVEGGSSEYESDLDKSRDTTDQSVVTSSYSSTASANQRARLVFQQQLKNADHSLDDVKQNGRESLEYTRRSSEGSGLKTIEENTENSSSASINTDDQENIITKRNKYTTGSRRHSHVTEDNQWYPVIDLSNGNRNASSPMNLYIRASSCDIPNPPHNTPTVRKVSSADEEAGLNLDIDDVSLTPPITSSDTHKKSLLSRLRRTSAACSGRSTPGEPSLELVLQAKIKISDAPVRCLVQTKSRKEHVIISCSGHEDDHEAMLQWTRLPNDTLWTNEVVSQERKPHPEPPLSAYRKFIRRISNSSFF